MEMDEGQIKFAGPGRQPGHFLCWSKESDQRKDLSTGVEHFCRDPSVVICSDTSDDIALLVRTSCPRNFAQWFSCTEARTCSAVSVLSESHAARGAEKESAPPSVPQSTSAVH
jgi:hypothetical protein